MAVILTLCGFLSFFFVACRGTLLTTEAEATVPSALDSSHDGCLAWFSCGRDPSRASEIENGASEASVESAEKKDAA